MLLFRKIVFGSAEYNLECALRQEVLRTPLGLSLWNEDLTQETQQLHFGLFDSGEVLVGCVIAVPISATKVKIRQMAVSPAWQKRGVGLRIMQDLEKQLQVQGFKCCELHARVSVIGFYKKLGYLVGSKEFLEITIPHVKMCKSLI